MRPSSHRKGARAATVARSLAICALAALLGSSSASGRTVIDDLGFAVRVRDKIERVVSLVPTNSEMVCLLDCERLKGGTRYDFFPRELQERIARKQTEIVGGGFDANLERIVRLQPDLILVNGPSQHRFAVPLKNMGYSVLSLWPRDVADLRHGFLLLAQLLGREDKAGRILDEMDAELRAIETRAQKMGRTRVYLQMWADPLITVGGSSFTDWLVGVAGGINVFGDMHFDSGQIGLESIIRRDPEVLIFLAGQESFAKTLRARPGWSAIGGVQQERFCFIEEPDIRRSVRFVDGLAKIQRCLFEQRASGAGPR